MKKMNISVTLFIFNRMVKKYGIFSDLSCLLQYLYIVCCLQVRMVSAYKYWYSDIKIMMYFVTVWMLYFSVFKKTAYLCQTINQLEIFILL